MEAKHRKILGMSLTAALWLGLTVAAWCRPPAAFSETERRELAQMPALTAENLESGRFMSDFESYTLDQFPLRDKFRGLKAQVHYRLLSQLDNNGIYFARGHAAKLEYPLQEASLDHALKVFGQVHDRYLGDSRIFAALVPDKGYFLARELGYPAMDYGALAKKMEQGMPYASYVNLSELLTIDDYYRTDPHWRQERLLPAAERLCAAMGVPGPGNMTAVPAETPFLGAYSGQAALPLKPDGFCTLQSDWVNRCRVLNYETGEWGEVYDWKKLSGRDPYETFLSGSVSLLRIENPYAETDRELIVFRDSFGSALAPLLCRGYRTVTLVDLRYLPGAMLSRFLDFHGQDVLFLYSTLVLNNSSQLR